MDKKGAGPDFSTTTALIAFSDTHENHVYGLGPPSFEKSDGDIVKANPVRRQLWDVWRRFWDQALEITEGMPRVAVAMGDIIESDAKVRAQTDLVSLYPPDALRMVSETLDPVAQETDALLVIRGTEAHVGQGAWQEEMVAQDFDTTIPDIENRNASWWHFYGEFGGVAFDIAHHASMGNIKRNLAGAAGRLAYDVRQAYIQDWGIRPPDVVLRAHNHRYADSGTTYETRAVMVGCFQFKSTYVHRINKAYEMPNLGGAVIICDRGKYELHPIRVKPKPRKLWTPKSL